MDDSKEAQVRELGGALKELELEGNYFGRFSLTIVVYDLDQAKLVRACADFYKVFSVHDGQLYVERYNLLNAFLATVPGNYALNFRHMYLLNTNYADFSFLFTLHCGEPRNHHLNREYLAVLETNHRTPYFLNLHYRGLDRTAIDTITKRLESALKLFEQNAPLAFACGYPLRGPIASGRPPSTPANQLAKIKTRKGDISKEL